MQSLPKRFKMSDLSSSANPMRFFDRISRSRWLNNLFELSSRLRVPDSLRSPSPLCIRFLFLVWYWNLYGMSSWF